jgi:TRAP-type C4-dicarboxylate transport system permease small subunit
MTQASESGDIAVAPPPPPPSKARFVLELVCALLLTVLFLLLLGSSLLRNHGYTAPAVYEFIRVTFVYVVGVSAIVAFARRANLCVPGWWKEDSVSYQMAMLVLSGILAFLTGQMLIKQGFSTDAASLLGLPEGTSYIPIGLFAIGLVILSASRLLAAIRRRRA